MTVGLFIYGKLLEVKTPLVHTVSSGVVAFWPYFPSIHSRPTDVEYTVKFAWRQKGLSIYLKQ